VTGKALRSIAPVFQRGLCLNTMFPYQASALPPILSVLVITATPVIACGSSPKALR
jgi:hypothetical protein